MLIEFTLKFWPWCCLFLIVSVNYWFNVMNLISSFLLGGVFGSVSFEAIDPLCLSCFILFYFFNLFKWSRYFSIAVLFLFYLISAPVSIGVFFLALQEAKTSSFQRETTLLSSSLGCKLLTSGFPFFALCRAINFL